MKSKSLDFQQAMKAIQLEFDFGVMETIDRSLNMPKKMYFLDHLVPPEVHFCLE